MMKNRMPKLEKRVMLKKCVRPFASKPVRVSAFFMSVRGTQDGKLLARRFEAMSFADVLENRLQSISGLKARLYLAAKYYMILKLQQRHAKSHRGILVNSLKAFVIDKKYTNLQHAAAIRAAHVAYLKVMAGPVLPVVKPALKVIGESVQVRKSKTFELPTKLPQFIVVPSVAPAIKNMVVTSTKITAKSPAKEPLSATGRTKQIVALNIKPQVKTSQKVLVSKSALFVKTKEQLLDEATARNAADFERLANIKPEDSPHVYSSPRAILAGERKMPAKAEPSIKSQKTKKHEIDPALTALIEKARARGKRTSSFLSPEEIPYLIKDSQVHKTLFFLGTSYMFYNYPNTIYYTAYIMFTYFVYLCVSRYNKYIV